MSIMKSLAALLLVILLSGCNPTVSENLVCGTTEFTDFAGSLSRNGGSADGTGTAAQFLNPLQIVNDGSDLYVLDAGNSSIRKIETATQEVTTFTTFASAPKSIASDGTYLYVALYPGDPGDNFNDVSNGTIVKIDIATAAVTTLPVSAPIRLANAMATDGTHLYFGQSTRNGYENEIFLARMHIDSGEVTRLSDGREGIRNGPIQNALFSEILGMELHNGTLYIAELRRIRKLVFSTGEVTTLAGDSRSALVDGPGAQASFYALSSLVLDGQSLYATDTATSPQDSTNYSRIRQIDIETGQVKTLIRFNEQRDKDVRLRGITKLGSAESPDGVDFFTTNTSFNAINKTNFTSKDCEDELSEQVSVSGRVTGLTAKLVLQEGVSEDTLFNDREFLFTVDSGSDYSVTVKTQPNGQICTVTNGSGTASSSVENVAVSCVASPTPPSDPTPPAAPTITDLTTTNQQPTLTGTFDSGEVGGQFFVTVNDQTFTLGTDDELSSAGDDWTLAIPFELAFNRYDIRAVAADAAGNTSSVAGLLTVVPAPPVPTVDSILTEDSTPTLTGVFDDANTTDFTVRVNGVTYTRNTDSALRTSGNSWNLTIPDANALPVGTYDVVVTATDSLNNSKIDATGNELEIASATGPANWSIEDVYTNDTTPTIRGMFPTDADVFSVATFVKPKYYLTTPINNAVTSNDPMQGNTLFEEYQQATIGSFDRSTGEWELTLVRGYDTQAYKFTDGLLEGEYLLRVSDKALSGLAVFDAYRKPVASAKLVIDLTAPAAPTVESQTTTNSTPTVTGAFDAADAEVLTVAVNGVTYTLGTDAALTASGDSWSLVIPSALAAGTYDVVATVQDKATNSTSDSTSDELVVNAVAPSVAPTGVSTLAGDEQVALSWTAVDGATSYNLYYGTSPGVTTASTRVTGATSGDAVTGLNNGTPYYFIVTAANSDGEGPASGEVSATPVDQRAPTVSASPAGTSFVTSEDVTLSCSDTGGSGCASIFYTLNDSTPTTGSTAYSGPITLSTTTTLKFLAVDGAGNQSAVGSETYTLSLPAAPTGVSATAGSGQVSLTWSAVTGATSYNAYYSASSGVTTASGTKVSNVSSGDAITGLVDEQTYYFIVTAENASGEGPASSEASAAPTTTDETAPTVIGASLSPADGATGVARDTDVSAGFDEDIFATTVDDSSFTLEGNDAVSSTVTFDGSTNVATLTPDSKLAVLTDHTATLTNGITDLAGNPLAANEVWSFTTADGAWQTTPDTVDTSAADNNSGRVVVDEQGVATAAWLEFDGSANSVVSNRYVPGSGWGGSPVSLQSTSDDASGVELAVDNDGNVFAVWQEVDGSIVTHVWAARYDAAGGSWGSAVQLETGSSDAGSARIAVDGNGNAIAVWIQFDGTRNNLWASRYSAGTWSTADLIENEDSNEALSPAIAMDSAGNAIVVWTLGDGFLSADVKATRFSGGTWDTTPVDLEARASSDIGFDPQVAMDSSGNAIAVWGQPDDSGTFNIWANRYDSGSGTWGGAVAIADGSGDGRIPKVAVDENGNALAVWVQGTGNDVWSNGYSASGTSWGAPEILDNLAGTADAPQIAMDATGHGLAVWFQNDGLGLSSTFANRYVAGVGWSGAITLENDDTEENNLNQPSLGMNSKGEAMAVWHQRQGNDIFDLWSNSFD